MTVSHCYVHDVAFVGMCSHCASMPPSLTIEWARRWETDGAEALRRGPPTCMHNNYKHTCRQWPCVYRVTID
jgi:hypothetical protein